MLTPATIKEYIFFYIFENYLFTVISMQSFRFILFVDKTFTFAGGERIGGGKFTPSLNQGTWESLWGIG